MANYLLTANGVLPDFASLELNILKMGTDEPAALPPIRGGLTAINFNYGPDGRENSYGNAPEPVGQVNGKMVYGASCTMQEVTYKKIIALLGRGYMRADRQIRISLTYRIDSVTTRVAITTSLGQTTGSWSEGSELMRDLALHPTRIRDVDAAGAEIEPMG